MTAALHQLLESASHHAEKTAIEESEGRSISYGDLARLSDRVRDRLNAMGIRPGDRVGLCLRKSADAVASIFGIMKAGAAYVPVDPTAPASRSAYIFHDCKVGAMIAEKTLVEGLQREFDQAGFIPHWIVLDGTGAGGPLVDALDQLDDLQPAASIASVSPAPDDLAYVLYTSGSTGRPKGVALSHANAACFIDWCSDVFEPTADDRFSSHAPFHFDLSVLDIYVSLKHGATLVIVEEGLGKDPSRLAPWIAEKKLTIWYSAPSILAMLAQFGHLERFDYTSLRIVLFAGEVFPIKNLRLLKSLWKHPKFFNLYGPTETNVCTWYEVPEVIPETHTEPVSIGKACAHCDARVVDPDGNDVNPGAEGELCIAGPTVLSGYWNLPENTAKAFFEKNGRKWYRTGDIVIELPDGNYKFLGRRDRMIKKRGYRIELGEIEAAVHRHPRINEVAVIALNGEDGVRIEAFASTRDGNKFSVIELKQFCSEKLPLYMVPDRFRCLDQIPKTSTGKVDYEKLRQMT